MRPLRLLQSIILAWLLLVPVVARACVDVSRDFDIDAQPLRSALLQFGRQSGCSLVFDPLRIPERQAHALKGLTTVAQALRYLLAQSGLEFRLLPGDIIAIAPRRNRDAARPQASAAQRAPPPVSADARANAAAQHALPTAQSPELESILVTATPTGSRIRGADFAGFAQLDVIAPETIRGGGPQGPAELLRFLPAVAGNSTSTQVTNGGDGTASITLRGLPASNTLVLIDGRRTNPDAFNARSVDLNTLPLAMIERIEVLKDGASAVYGSDAIAGVINIVTRSPFSGLRVDAYYGQTQRDDLQTQQLNLLYGLATGAANDDFGEGKLMLALSSYRQDGIASRDRRLSRNADSRAQGGTDQRSTATPAPRVVLEGAAYVRNPSGGSSDSTLAFRPANDADRFNQREYTDAVVPSQRDSAFVRWNAPLSAHWAFIGDALLSRTESVNRLAPVPLFTAFDGQRTPVRADASFNPFGIELTDVRRRMVEFGTRHFHDESRSQRYSSAFAFTGDTATADITLSYHQTAAQEGVDGVLLADRLAQSLGSAELCVAACRRVNLLDGPGAISPDAVRFLQARTRTDAISVLAAVSGNASFVAFELPAGSARLATGFDLRREAIDVRPDAELRANNIIGATASGRTRGDRRVYEAYVELLAPLLAGRAGLRSLDLSLAARASRYSDFGGTVNPKAALRYRPSDALLLRAAWGKGFRAPTLRQLFVASESSFDFLNDPCASAELAASLAGCRGQSDPTLSQFLTLRGGNPDLLPERASTLTFGVVYSPTQTLSASVDYYSIGQRDVVDANAQFVLNQNARFGRFADRVQRDAQGNLLEVQASPINIGRRAVSGWDVGLHYSFESTPRGVFDVAVNTSYINSFQDQLNPDTPTRQQAGRFSDEASSGNGSLPHWKASVGLQWQQSAWNGRYSIYYVSPLREQVPESERARRIDAWVNHNLQISYVASGPGAQLWRTGAASTELEVALGVENLFDAEPPFAASAFNDNFDGRTYSLAGRYVYLRVSAGTH